MTPTGSTAQSCEDWNKVQPPNPVIGGWNDAYSNAIPRMMRNLRVPRKAIIGPMGTQVSALRRAGTAHRRPAGDAALVGLPPQEHQHRCHTDPDYRIISWTPTQDSRLPEEISGRWIAESFWGHGTVDNRTWNLTANGIAPKPGTEKDLKISSRQTCGFDGGEYCIIWLRPEFPGDQRDDDAQSLTFNSPELAEDMEIVGQPTIDLHFTERRWRVWRFA